MLKEIQGLSAEAEGLRRWFHDDLFDLFVWQSPQGEVTSFQLCYGTHTSEQALVWKRGGKLFHDGPVAEGRAAASTTGQAVLAGFEVAARELPAEIIAAVAARVREYARGAEVPSRRRRFRRADWQKIGTPG